MLEPLAFKDKKESGEGSSASCSPCFLCESVYPMNDAPQRKSFLAHVLQTHKLVIANAPDIPLFYMYVDYWREHFEGKALSDFCHVINTNSAPNDIGEKEQYYLLSDTLPEDKRLRDSLQRKRLEIMLADQQLERSDASFSQTCLFCKKHFVGSRSLLFDHMVADHSFNVGNVENIVYTKAFLNLLRNKLDRLLCLYCEKVFKDWATLREHMRKKQHKRINPQNKEYNRFYVINYLEAGKTWEEIHAEDDGSDIANQLHDSANVEREWQEWDEVVKRHSVCLFCSERHLDVTQTMEHMQDAHGFDFASLRHSDDSEFYNQVKKVNYIRHKVYQNTCPFCCAKFDDAESVRTHMEGVLHCRLPEDKTVWDKPEYFFSTYDNDALLWYENET